MNDRPRGGIMVLAAIGMVACCILIKAVAVGGLGALMVWFRGGGALWGGLALACAVVLGIVVVSRLRRRRAADGADGGVPGG